jgi:hypothetical protein
MNGHEKYEVMKQGWISDNPNATPQEYQTAMRRIAEKCGI